MAGAYEPDSLDCLYSYEKRKIEFSLVLRKLKVPIPGDSNKYWGVLAGFRNRYDHYDYEKTKKTMSQLSSMKAVTSFLN